MLVEKETRGSRGRRAAAILAGMLVGCSAATVPLGEIALDAHVVQTRVEDVGQRVLLGVESVDADAHLTLVPVVGATSGPGA